MWQYVHTVHTGHPKSGSGWNLYISIVDRTASIECESKLCVKFSTQSENYFLTKTPFHWGRIPRFGVESHAEPEFRLQICRHNRLCGQVKTVLKHAVVYSQTLRWLKREGERRLYGCVRQAAVPEAAVHPPSQARAAHALSRALGLTRCAGLGLVLIVSTVCRDSFPS